MTTMITLLLATARADCPTDYDFIVIADDTGDLALQHPSAGSMQAVPAINASGQVAFRAWVGDGTGLYVGDEERLTEVVLDSDADPRPGLDVRFAGDPAFNDADSMVVYGAVAGSSSVHHSAILSVGASGVRVVAHTDRNDPDNPSAFLYLDEHVDIASDGAAVYAAGEGADTVIFRGIAERYRASDMGVWGLSSPATSASGDIAYVAFQDAAFVPDVYRGRATIAEGDPDSGLGPTGRPVVSGGGAVVYGFAYPDPNHAGRAAFRVERSVGGRRVVLADSGQGDLDYGGRLDVATGRSLISASGPLPYDTDCTVFNGIDPTAGGEALFIANEDSLGFVVTDDDLVDGSIPSFVRIGPHAMNARGQVAFFAELGGRQAIVRADPIELPSDPIDPVDPRDPVDTGDPREPLGGVDDPEGTCACGTTSPGSFGWLTVWGVGLWALRRRPRTRQR